MDPRFTALEDTLRKIQHQYQCPQRLRDDVSFVLKRCTTLQPSMGNFSGQGRQVTLFFLYGVLPITYAGATYNIPVTIYFDPPYPRQGPRCFVTPTSGMAFKPGHQHVDQGGMIYLPYLSQWDERTSNLPDLVTTIQSVFSQMPPVYSTGSSARPAQQPAHPVHPSGQQSLPVAQGVPVASAHAVPTQQPPQQPKSERDRLLEELERMAKERWPTLLKPYVDEVNAALTKDAELRAGAASIQADIEHLGRQAARNEVHVAELASMEEALTQHLATVAEKEPDPDDLRTQQDPDAQQVLDLLAEEMALEEYCSALDDLFAAKKISIEDFLRETRDVSRKQYMNRALRKKAAGTVASLDEAAPSLPQEARATQSTAPQRVLVAA